MATPMPAPEPITTDIVSENHAQYIPDRCVLPFQAAIGILSLRYAEMSESSGPLAALLFFLIQRCDRVNVMTLKDLRAALVDHHLDEVLEFLDGTLDSIQSPDDLFDIFMQIESCINNDTSDTINRSSPLGIYLREIVLAFNTLPFSGISQLFDDLLQFRSGTLPETTCRPNVLRKFIRERAIDIERSSGESSFSETELLLSKLMDSKKQLPSEAYYLGFLDCIFHREFEGAISNLHLFFDLTGYSNQLAVLALALLHCHLGHYPAAHQTLRETVRIAQQNNDADCLLRALSLQATLENETTGHTPLELRLLNGALSALLTTKGNHPPGREAFACLDSNNIVGLIQAQLNASSKASELWPLIQIGLSCIKDSASASERDHIGAGIQFARSQTWLVFSNKHLASIAAQCAARFSPDSFLKNHASKALLQIDAIDKNLPSPRSEIAKGRHPCDFSASAAGVLHCHMDNAAAKIRELFQERRWRQAWDLSEELLSHCRRRHATVHVERVLLLQAEIAASTSDILVSMPMILEASQIASQSEPASLPVTLECRLRIATMFLSLGAPKLALQTLKQSLSLILEHLSSELKAQTFIMMAKSILQIWRGTAPEDKEKRDICLQKAIYFLNNSLDFCSNNLNLQTEIWYLLSNCWNSARRYDKRKRCAEEFLRCQQLSFVN